MLRTSETISELATALAAAQGEMGNAILNKVNPHFRSKYADFAAVRDATLPALSKHGLAVTQCTCFDGDGSFLLVTRLVHATGQWIESVYPLPMLPDKPQIMGSAQTYARRYSWAGICGIASEEDDDANTAQQATGNGIPARKSSAQAKRDDDWPKLEHALSDCGSAVAVDKLQRSYQDNEYRRWSQTWREQADELFDKRRQDFGVAPGEATTLREQLAGSLEATEPTTRAEYIQVAHDFIATVPTEAELRAWWVRDKPARKRFRLTPAEESDLETRAKIRVLDLQTATQEPQTTFVPNARERAEMKDKDAG